MEYGLEIKRGDDAWPKDDVRPVWLADDMRIAYLHLTTQNWVYDTSVGDWKSGSGGFRYITAIRLPADHWAYRAIAAGFVPWAGGDKAPNDWDGGEVLLEEGLVIASFQHLRWSRTSLGPDIIGYRTRTEAPADSDTVTIKQMTEAEFRWYCEDTESAIAWARQNGVILPTEAERIAAETGLIVADVQKVLNARNG